MAQEPPSRSPEREFSNPHEKSEKSAGFISRLAQRSTGLQPPSPPPRDEEDRSLWAMAGMGVQVVGATLVFAAMGYFLDRHFGWLPWGTVSLGVLGFIGGFYLLIKQALRLTK